MFYSAEDLEKGIQSTFLKYMGSEQPAIVTDLCETVDSTSDEEKHAWVGQPAHMSEFKGSVTLSAPTSGSKTIENKVYTGGFSYSIDDLRRSKGGAIVKQIQRLARKVNAHVVKTLMAQIVANGNCYDGTAMFGNAHTARKNEGGTQDNNLALTGTTVANIQTDFGLALAAMLGFLDEEGDPFHGDSMEGVKLRVCANPAQMFNMNTALDAAVISQTSNVWTGFAKPYYTPRITASSWYMFRADEGGPKPYIYQPELAASISLDTTDEKKERKHHVIAEVAYGIGEAAWQSGVKVA